MDKGGPLSIQVNGIDIPVKVKHHRRNSIRYSISKRSVNLSIPTFYSKHKLEGELEKLNVWAYAQFENNPGLLKLFKTKSYQDGDVIDICNQRFTLRLTNSNQKTATAKIDKQDVSVKIPSSFSDTQKNKIIGILMSRIFSKYFHNLIYERVQYYNDKYFKEEIGTVRLKNNRSNWGSCSSRKNINLSSRLLFAPQQVLDYVIVHELTHLKEMNHSKRFWEIIISIMPEYKKYELWLKQNGHKLSF